MKGTEAYELKYKNTIDKLIQNNPDKPYLRGFYNFMGSRLSISTKCDYIYYIVSFINFSNKDIKDLDLDDYTNFLSQIEDRTASYQISVYSGLKKFAKYLLASKISVNNVPFFEKFFVQYDLYPSVFKVLKLLPSTTDVKWSRL